MSDLGSASAVGLWGLLLLVSAATYVWRAGGVAIAARISPDGRLSQWFSCVAYGMLAALISRIVLLPVGILAETPLIDRLLALAAVRRRRPLFVPALLLVAAGLAAFFASGDSRLSEERSAELVGNLLHNVYRAFDFRDEERIYDTLSRSVAGDLLEQIYLETRRGLELASQGGARAKVKEVELVELDADPADGGGFRATAVWRVRGSVGHWGHVHQRRNQYRAELGVAPKDGAWKLVKLDVLEEERL